MDVIAIDWEKGIVICSYVGKTWISLIEHGDLLQHTGRRDKYKKEVYEKALLLEMDSLGDKKLEVYWDDKLSSFRTHHQSDRVFRI